MTNVRAAAPPPFRRAWWLPGAHLETIAPFLSPPPPAPYRRAAAATADGDDIALDYAEGRDGAPGLIIFHGLEGCSQSHTIRAVARAFIAAGWHVAAPNFRACGGKMNRQLRAYHAADVDEIGDFINIARRHLPDAVQWCAAGVSLGGAAMMNWLAANPAQNSIAAAAAICAPFSLEASSRALNAPRSLNRLLYARYFLHTMRKKALEKMRRFPHAAEKVDFARVKKARTTEAFDEAFTAPVHGFASARHYWRAASVRQNLGRIRTPLLCINAQNDPLVPMHSVPQPDEVSPPVYLLQPRHGGHGGFVGAPQNWLTDRMFSFFAESAAVSFKSDSQTRGKDKKGANNGAH